MNSEKYFAWFALIGTASLTANVFFIYNDISNKMAVPKSQTNEQQIDLETGSVWRAAYTQAMEDKEAEIQLSYEEGYHKATEDMSCPAGGSANIDAAKPETKK